MLKPVKLLRLSLRFSAVISKLPLSAPLLQKATQRTAISVFWPALTSLLPEAR
ncbi:hypothetical protein EVA_20024 [gut metagenome]|uniref:Uncharacterized protein n=1 Tax=gut metagenome TaxID=749906 RepID=J9FBQ9_9ZZZZ